MISLKAALSACWSNATGRYVSFAFGHPRLLFLAFAVAAVAAVAAAKAHLRVVTDLETLLPEGCDSVAALDESRRRVGSSDFFVIAIRSESKDIAAIAAMQEALAARIADEWPDAGWVQFDRDTRFFLTHALYYLPEEKLAELEEILREALHREAVRSLPGAADLSDSEAVSLEAALEAWMTPALLRGLGMPPQVEAAFLGLFDRARAEGAPAAAGRCARYADRLIGPESDVGVVLVQLERPSTDLDYARFALNRGRALIEDIDPTSIAPDLSVQVVGAYRSFKEVDAVSSDGALATAVSVTSVLALLLSLFRSPRRILAIFIPLAFAGAYTMGTTALIFGRLTVLTVFVLAMLAGMGIDYGIHFLGRILEATGTGEAPERACRAAARDTGSALLAAAATTIVSMLVLLLGHFPGFREFSVVASVGVLFSVLSSLLVLPPLIALFPSVVAVPGDRGSLLSALPRLTPRLARRKRALLVAAAAAALAFTAAAGASLGGLAFEHDFRNLRGPSTGASIGYGRAIGKNASTTPSIILGRSEAEMAAVHAYLLERLDDPFLHSFITIRTFVPAAGDQAARGAIISRIHGLAAKKAFSRVTGPDAELVRVLREMSATSRFTKAELPLWATRLLTEQDGSVGKIGHLYARVKDWDVTSVAGYKERFQQIPLAEGTVRVASSAFILADIVEMVTRDALSLSAWVTAALFLLLFAYTRTFAGALVVLSTVIAGAVWTAGAMSLLGVKVGLYNMITIPVILGVGIDGAIHIYHRFAREGRWTCAVTAAGTLVTAGSMTTIAGFSGLLFVSHRGLETIGVMACLGVGATYLATVTVLPLWLSLLGRRGAARARLSRIP